MRTTMPGQAALRRLPGRRRGTDHKLVEKWKVALPLHPEYGLEPNVFYVPPMSPSAMDANGRPTGEARIPIATLEGLFGPQVRAALATVEAEREKRKRGEPSELMDLLIAYDWNESFKLDAKEAVWPREEAI